MPYLVQISEVARREMRQLPGNVRQRIRRLVDSLANLPRPPRAKELRGLPGRYRIPLEDWRIIYRIDDENQLIYVLKL